MLQPRSRRSLFNVQCMCVCVCQEEVLMVQEAKQDCYKQWYLPAGRVEVGESLEEALRREVRDTHTHSPTLVMITWLQLFVCR